MPEPRLTPLHHEQLWPGVQEYFNYRLGVTEDEADFDAFEKYSGYLERLEGLRREDPDRAFDIALRAMEADAGAGYEMAGRQAQLLRKRADQLRRSYAPPVGAGLQELEIPIPPEEAEEQGFDRVAKADGGYEFFRVQPSGSAQARVEEAAGAARERARQARKAYGGELPGAISQEALGRLTRLGDPSITPTAEGETDLFQKGSLKDLMIGSLWAAWKGSPLQFLKPAEEIALEKPDVGDAISRLGPWQTGATETAGLLGGLKLYSGVGHIIKWGIGKIPMLAGALANVGAYGERMREVSGAMSRPEVVRTMKGAFPTIGKMLPESGLGGFVAGQAGKEAAALGRLGAEGIQHAPAIGLFMGAEALTGHDPLDPENWMSPFDFGGLAQVDPAQAGGLAPLASGAHMIRGFMEEQLPFGEQIAGFKAPGAALFPFAFGRLGRGRPTSAEEAAIDKAAAAPKRRKGISEARLRAMGVRPYITGDAQVVEYPMTRETAQQLARAALSDKPVDVERELGFRPREEYAEGEVPPGQELLPDFGNSEVREGIKTRWAELSETERMQNKELHRHRLLVEAYEKRLGKQQAEASKGLMDMSTAEPQLFKILQELMYKPPNADGSLKPEAVWAAENLLRAARGEFKAPTKPGEYARSENVESAMEQYNRLNNLISQAEKKLQEWDAWEKKGGKGKKPSGQWKSRAGVEKSLAKWKEELEFRRQEIEGFRTPKEEKAPTGKKPPKGPSEPTEPPEGEGGPPTTPPTGGAPPTEEGTPPTEGAKAAPRTAPPTTVEQAQTEGREALEELIRKRQINVEAEARRSEAIRAISEGVERHIDKQLKGRVKPFQHQDKTWGARLDDEVIITPQYTTKEEAITAALKVVPLEKIELGAARESVDLERIIRDAIGREYMDEQGEFKNRDARRAYAEAIEGIWRNALRNVVRRRQVSARVSRRLSPGVVNRILGTSAVTLSEAAKAQLRNLGLPIRPGGQFGQRIMLAKILDVTVSGREPVATIEIMHKGEPVRAEIPLDTLRQWNAKATKKTARPLLDAIRAAEEEHVKGTSPSDLREQIEGGEFTDEQLYTLRGAVRMERGYLQDQLAEEVRPQPVPGEYEGGYFPTEEAYEARVGELQEKGKPVPTKVPIEGKQRIPSEAGMGAREVEVRSLITAPAPELMRSKAGAARPRPKAPRRETEEERASRLRLERFQAKEAAKKAPSGKARVYESLKRRIEEREAQRTAQEAREEPETTRPEALSPVLARGLRKWSDQIQEKALAEATNGRKTITLSELADVAEEIRLMAAGASDRRGIVLDRLADALLTKYEAAAGREYTTPIKAKAKGQALTGASFVPSRVSVRGGRMGAARGRFTARESQARLRDLQEKQDILEARLLEQRWDETTPNPEIVLPRDGEGRAYLDAKQFHDLMLSGNELLLRNGQTIEIPGNLNVIDIYREGDFHIGDRVIPATEVDRIIVRRDNILTKEVDKSGASKQAGRISKQEARQLIRMMGDRKGTKGKGGIKDEALDEIQSEILDKLPDEALSSLAAMLRPEPSMGLKTGENPWVGARHQAASLLKRIREIQRGRYTGSIEEKPGELPLPAGVTETLERGLPPMDMPKDNRKLDKSVNFRDKMGQILVDTLTSKAPTADRMRKMRRALGNLLNRVERTYGARGLEVARKTAAGEGKEGGVIDALRRRAAAGVEDDLRIVEEWERTVEGVQRWIENGRTHEAWYEAMPGQVQYVQRPEFFETEVAGTKMERMAAATAFEEALEARATPAARAELGDSTVVRTESERGATVHALTAIIERAYQNWDVFEGDPAAVRNVNRAVAFLRHLRAGDRVPGLETDVEARSTKELANVLLKPISDHLARNKRPHTTKGLVREARTYRPATEGKRAGYDVDYYVATGKAPNVRPPLVSQLLGETPAGAPVGAPVVPFKEYGTENTPTRFRWVTRDEAQRLTQERKGEVVAEMPKAEAPAPPSARGAARVLIARITSTIRQLENVMQAATGEGPVDYASPLLSLGQRMQAELAERAIALDVSALEGRLVGGIKGKRVRAKGGGTVKRKSGKGFPQRVQQRPTFEDLAPYIVEADALGVPLPANIVAEAHRIENMSIEGRAARRSAAKAKVEQETGEKIEPGKLGIPVENVDILPNVDELALPQEVKDRMRTRILPGMGGEVVVAKGEVITWLRGSLEPRRHGSIESALRVINKIPPEERANVHIIMDIDAFNKYSKAFGRSEDVAAVKEAEREIGAAEAEEAMSPVSTLETLEGSDEAFAEEAAPVFGVEEPAGEVIGSLKADMSKE